MINLPTDSLPKFFALLGLAMLSASVAHLAVLDDKNTTAQMSANAALIEESELLKQTAAAYRLATERYREGIRGSEESRALIGSGKLIEAAGKLAGVEEFRSRGKESEKRGDELQIDAQKKEVEAARLAANAKAVSVSVARQSLTAYVVLALGCMSFAWGVFAWARTGARKNVPMDTST